MKIAGSLQNHGLASFGAPGMGRPASSSKVCSSSSASYMHMFHLYHYGYHRLRVKYLISNASLAFRKSSNGYCPHLRRCSSGNSYIRVYKTELMKPFSTMWATLGTLMAWVRRAWFLYFLAPLGSYLAVVFSFFVPRAERRRRMGENPDTQRRKRKAIADSFSRKGDKTAWPMPMAHEKRSFDYSTKSRNIVPPL